MATSESCKHKTNRLLAPRHWPNWLLMGLAYGLSQLPYRSQMWLGARLGRLAQALIAKRRRIAAINLRLCYPDLNTEKRQELLNAQFRSVGQGALETGIGWWGRQAKIERLSHAEGLENLEAAAMRGRGIILLSAHTNAHVLGLRMSKQYLSALGYRLTAMFKPPHDPVVDHVIRRQYHAHIGPNPITDNDVVKLIAALRRGEAVWYAADQKAEKRLSVIVDFFGQPARTHIAISRLARMTRATVVPFFTLRRDDGQGYRLIFKPPLQDFPSDDEAADARQINAMIESVVNEDPAQYFWLHQRFKGTGHNPYRSASKKRR